MSELTYGHNVWILVSLNVAGANPWDPEVAQQRIREQLHLDGALLPILHALQEEFGYIDEAAEPLIAAALNRSRAEIHGVVTFYHDFRRAPGGRHVVKLCRAEACQAVGGDALAMRACARLGVALGETAADGRVSLEPVYCLGLCAVAPSAMVDGRVVGRLEAQRLDALLAEVER
jgi:formate dehydrogenase subunit gamma